MADYIRRLVSGPKARFKDSALGLELDLVYVTDHVIIMGYPATGMEGLYRNRRRDAKRFLDHRHGKDYWVYNFCPIRENSYDKSVFEGRVTRFPFPDHHVPPLAILPLAAREIKAWLNGSLDHVAILHCKAGKGRSGTMACSYLLTLDATPTPPQLERSHDAREWARIRADKAIGALPEEDEILEDPKTQIIGSSHTTNDRSKPFIEKSTHKTGIISDTAGILDEAGDSPPVVSPLSFQDSPNPEKSFTDSLKGVLDLHTARRMKPVANTQPSSSPIGSTRGSGMTKEKKQKQGVSIPSQRRWLYYWALLLAGEAPKDVWSCEGGSSLSGVKPLKSKTEKPKVRITHIRLRMRETSNVKLGIVRAANVVLDRAGSQKVYGSNPKASHSSSSVASSSSGSDKKHPNQIWASVARYDDELVDVLEKWEMWTRDVGEQEGGSGMGRRKKGTESMPAGVVGVEHELNELFDENGRWDKGKMVRSFARFGLRDSKDEVIVENSSENGKHKIHCYNLHLLSNERWDSFKQRVISSPAAALLLPGTEGGAPNQPSVPSIRLDRPTLVVPLDDNEDVKKNIESPGVPGSEVNSLYDLSSVQEDVQCKTYGADDGLVLDASREVRIKLYMGQIFMGWFWFIPTFHILPPSPTSSPDLTTNPTRSRTLFHLTRKELDFPLGIGSGILDVDVEMEWVVPHARNAETTVDPAEPYSE